jgi:NAD(P)-dependent dehydrogenase (short-subunit alcohol dehydrogenase family)
MKILIVGGAGMVGRKLAERLAADGWNLVIDARGEAGLVRVADELSEQAKVVAIAGDVADELHRRRLVEAVGPGLDVLVNNASLLGPSPQPELRAYPLDELRRVYETNVIAPLALAQLAVPLMRPGATIVNVTSDAAVEAYEGWGGYGSAKAALDQISRVLAVEHPELRVYAVDPGDMRTQMQQDAYPGEDISDRPPPEESVPGFMALLDGDLPSGRYAARELAAALR